MAKYVILGKFINEEDWDANDTFVEPFTFSSKEAAMKYLKNHIVYGVIHDHIDDFEPDEAAEEEARFDFDEHDMTLYFDNCWRWEFEIIPVKEYNEVLL